MSIVLNGFFFGFLSMQIKFGGPGRAKQTCMMRQCLQPMLPVTAQCVFCNLDGWRQPPVTSPQAKSHVSQDLGPSTLMECSVCYEIAHADCAQKANSETSQVNGVVNEDLPNSWECPTCCVSGKNNDYKVRTEQSISKMHHVEIKNSQMLISQKTFITVFNIQEKY